MRRILVVDDDRPIRLAIGMWLNARLAIIMRARARCDFCVRPLEGVIDH